MPNTLGDVLDSVLSTPRRLFWLLLLLGGAFLIAIGAVWSVVTILGLRASEVTVNGENTKVVFESVEKKTGNGDYLVVVNPEGWQSTGIDVRAGDKLTFHAGGKICIDMNSIWEVVQARKRFEDRVAKEQKIRQNDETETRVPEDYFTTSEKQQLILTRPWVDPDGFDLRVFQPSFRSRRGRYLLPDKPAGGLVGSVKPGAGDPQPEGAFFIGREDTYVAPRDGQLWFTVNDVQSHDPTNPNLFYNDNVGSFWVRVTVRKH